MSSGKIGIVVFFSVCALAIIANIIGDGTLMLLSKPFIIPSIYFYYFIKSKKVSILFSVMLFVCYIGESIPLLGLNHELYIVLIPFFISNCILIYIVLKNKIPFKYTLLNTVSLVLTAMLLTYLWFSIMDLLEDLPIGLRSQIGVYGVSILLLVFVVAYKCIYSITITSLCLFIYVVCILLSDIFYVIYTYEANLVTFDIIHFSVQMVSYFFLVHYILGEEKNRLNEINI